MTSTHEVIHYGDNVITGEQGDVIKWKLTGKGWTHVTPTYTATITSVVATDLPNVVMNIYAIGKLRYITLSQTIGANSNGHVISFAAATIPAAHYPKASVYQNIPAVITTGTGPWTNIPGILTLYDDGSMQIAVTDAHGVVGQVPNLDPVMTLQAVAGIYEAV
jgi:hypothetical protein